MILFWMLACATSDADVGKGNDPCEPGDTPTLEIGKGDLSFTPMSENEGEIDLVHGPQGGFHVVIALRATFLDTSESAIGHLTGTLNGEVIADEYPYLVFRCNGPEGAEESWGALLVYDATPEELNGQETTINATVTDSGGREISATTNAFIIDPLL